MYFLAVKIIWTGVWRGCKVVWDREGLHYQTAAVADENLSDATRAEMRLADEVMV